MAIEPKAKVAPSFILFKGIYKHSILLSYRAIFIFEVISLHPAGSPTILWGGTYLYVFV
jgi:hypothetical protein